MSTLNDPPKMQPATVETRVEPVTRGPKRAAVVSGSLAAVATAFMGGAVMLAQPLGAPVMLLYPWLAPVLVLGALASYAGSAVAASLAGIEAPKPPVFIAQKEDKS